MRRSVLTFTCLAILMIACRAVSFASQPARPLAARPQQASSSTSAPAPTPTQPAARAPYTVIYHPDGPLFVGDQISFEIIPQSKDISLSTRVEVRAVESPKGLGAASFAKYGIGERLEANLSWAWDTRELKPGDHRLVFSIQPSGLTFTETVVLQPQRDLPPPEPGAHWASTRSQCCILNYITGTDAQRDLDRLKKMADDQAQDAVKKLGTGFGDPMPIVFIPRVLGHGGFTGQEIAVSYLDRNYAVSNAALVLHHEMIHLLDNRLGSDYRPTMLIEGLAVYLSGGHFKPEPLMPRAAALLPPVPGCQPVEVDALETIPPTPGSPQSTAEPGRPACGLNRLIPLATLADDFYQSQHEIGYLESSALIQYMVQTWGFTEFSAFYRDIHKNGQSDSQAMSAALQAHFKITLSELELRYRQALRQEQVTPEQVLDVQLTIQYFDTVRRYQRLLDPSAYFMYAWLPDTVQMRQRGIVADLLRRPSAPVNLAIETLLIQSGTSLLDQSYARTDRLLRAINNQLDTYEKRTSGGLAYIPWSPGAWVMP